MLDINITLIIQIVNIIVLFILVKYFLFKPLMSVISQRQEKIVKHITDAEMVREEAETMKEKYRERLDQVEAEGAKILKEYRNEGERIKREIVEKARNEANRIIEHAHLDVQHKYERAEKEMMDQSAAMAVELAGRLLKEYLDPDAQKEIAFKLAQKVKEINER